MKRFIVFLFLSIISLPLTVLADGANTTPSPIGSNIRFKDGSIWFRRENTRQGYTSLEVFSSYRFNLLDQVIPASPDDYKLTIADPVTPQDGRAYCTALGASKGSCFLMSQGQKYAFINLDVLKGAGFILPKPSKIDFDQIPTAGNISENQTAHKPGVFINDQDIVKLITETGTLTVPDLNTFYSWGYSYLDIVPANTADTTLAVVGTLQPRKAGQLNPLPKKLPTLAITNQDQLGMSISTPSSTLGSQLLNNQVPIGWTDNLLTVPKSNLVKSRESNTVYYLTSRGYKKPLTSEAVLNSYGKGLGDVEIVSEALINNYLPIPCITVFADPHVYRLNQSGADILKQEEIASRCPYPEQRLEINTFELRTYSQNK